MARYDLYCTECEFEFEVTQSIHDKLPTECPKCGHVGVKQHYPVVATKTATGLDNLERLTSQAVKDSKRLEKGEDRALSDLVGDKPNPLKKG